MDRTSGEDEWVTPFDVRLAAMLCNGKTGPALRDARAYRNRLIRRCDEQGDVAQKDLAHAARLSESRIRAIIREEPERPDERPKLRVVR